MYHSQNSTKQGDPKQVPLRDALPFSRRGGHEMFLSAAPDSRDLGMVVFLGTHISLTKVASGLGKMLPSFLPRALPGQ